MTHNKNPLKVNDRAVNVKGQRKSGSRFHDFRDNERGKVLEIKGRRALIQWDHKPYLPTWIDLSHLMHEVDPPVPVALALDADRPMCCIDSGRAVCPQHAEFADIMPFFKGLGW